MSPRRLLPVSLAYGGLLYAALYVPLAGAVVVLEGAYYGMWKFSWHDFGYQYSAFVVYFALPLLLAGLIVVPVVLSALRFHGSILIHVVLGVLTVLLCTVLGQALVLSMLDTDRRALTVMLTSFPLAYLVLPSVIGGVLAAVAHTRGTSS